MLNAYDFHSDVYAGYVDRAQRERAEAMSRVGYLTVVGIEHAARPLGRLIRAGLRSAREHYARWNERRHTIRALSRLDERLLRDIGVDPNSLELVVDELVAKPRTGEPLPPSGSPARAPAAPVLRLDSDCPDLRHAA